MCTTITLLDELELQKHLNACLRKVVTCTLEFFLNLKCQAVSDLLCFRFFIQLRSQRAARVMWSLRCRFSWKLPQHPVVLIWKKFLLKIKFSKLQQQYPNGENLIKQLFHSRLLDMRLVTPNLALRASLAIYHLLSNARSWNNWRGAWNKALSDFWWKVKFSFCFTSQYNENWKENLAIYQKSPTV